MELGEYARHSAISDPGPYAALLNDVPTKLPELTAVVRNLVVHYRAGGVALGEERLAEVNNRWAERILATDQKRSGGPLDRLRPVEDRVAGCCRDFTLLTVAVLRQHGIPARSRVGFASYFAEDFHHDHVVAEVWDGDRWVWADAQLGARDDFDSLDIPPDAGLFDSVAKVWTAYRKGEIDVDRYGVGEDLPVRGDWFVYDYVFLELAHRRREEVLLWDSFGAMVGDIAHADVGLADHVAALLLAADAGDARADQELTDRYRNDDRLNPGGTVHCISPTGGAPFVVDLRSGPG